MATIFSYTALPWDDATSILGSVVRLPWDDGATIFSNGGTYTAPSPPAGGTTAVPNTNPRFTIASRSLYTSNPGLLVKDLRDGSTLVVNSVSLSEEDSSPFWTVDMDGPLSLWTSLSAGTQPALVSVDIGAKTWNFIIEAVSQERIFGKRTTRVRGRSITASAAEPNQFSKNWTIDGATTALQIATSANLLTGVEVFWGITDWLIPDKVFSFSGTPLGVVKRIADAVGALVLSDTSLLKVTVAPRYPLLPNEWPLAPPDVELAIDAVQSDSFEVLDNPNYDGVYTLGQQDGAYAFVRLAGTTGANLSPLTSDQLLTDLPANMERGRSILGGSGKKQMRSMQVPVLTGSGEPGVFEVNWLVRVVDEAETWWGMVRRVSVQATYDSAVQSIALERQLEYVPGTVLSAPLPTPLTFVGPIADQSVVTGGSLSASLGGNWIDGVPPYTWSLRSGTLPSWASLDTATAVISGTAPGTTGSTPIALRCKDSINSTADSNTFNLVVATAGTHLTMLGSASRRVAQAANAAGTWAVPGTTAPYSGSNLGGAYDGTTLVAFDSANIYYSLDKGDTWTFAYTRSGGMSGPSYGYSRLVHYSGGFIIPLLSASGSPVNVKSVDGQTWTTSSATTPPSLWADAYSATADAAGVIYVAINDFVGDTTQVVSSADDGATWATEFSDTASVFSVDKILLGSGTIMLVDGTGSVVKTSTSWGGTWTDHTLPNFPQPRTGAYGAGKFIIPITSGQFMMVSGDLGLSWTSVDLTSLYDEGTYGSLADFVFDGTFFVAVYSSPFDNTSVVLRSSDGVTWAASTGPVIKPKWIIPTP